MSLPRSSFSQYVDLSGDRATFAGVIPDFTPAATPTDYITLSNPAGSGKILRIVGVRITATSTAVAEYDFYCYKRTAVNTGGTVAVVTPAPCDSQNASTVGVLNTYSVNPTGLGTGILMRGEQYALPAIATTGYPFSPIIWFNEMPNAQVPIIRPGELISLNGGGNALPAGTVMYITIVWSEDDQ